MNHGILKLRTATQVAIFRCELRGQFSDGNWENTRPLNHWTPWSNCSVVIDPHEQGRNFYAAKSNYNLLDAGLLDVVGDRMISYAKLAMAFGAANALEVRNVVTIEGDIRPNGTDYKALEVLYPDQAAKAIAMDYNIVDLRADLKEISAAMKHGGGYAMLPIIRLARPRPKDDPAASSDPAKRTAKLVDIINNRATPDDWRNRPIVGLGE